MAESANTAIISLTKPELQARHRQEAKDLKVKTDALQKTIPKNDKDIKKKITTEVQQMQRALNEKHKQEAEAWEAAHTKNDEDDASGEEDDITDRLLSLNTSDKATTTTTKQPAKPEPKKSAPPPAAGAKKVSRAQKRKAAAAQKEQDKLDRVRQAAANNESKRDAEYKAINEKLQQDNLKIHEIPADGNCLFAALAEQMKLSGRGIDYNWQILRALASQYMSENSNDFIAFVDFPTDEFPKYCEKIKSDPATWGSQLEIQAISSTLKVPVEVISADAPAVLMGEEFASPDEAPLRVSFHKHAYTLGEHYNSVVPISMAVKEKEGDDEDHEEGVAEHDDEGALSD